MPTLPVPPAAQNSHTFREAAEGFGTDAARYDRARPRYPQPLIDRIVAGSPGHDLLDVGTGTGIVARQLQAAGCTVLGVEPDPRMAEFARASGVPVQVSKLEDWDPAGRTFDAAVAGMTWHWVDPVAGAAKIAEALRPNGRIAVFWNAFILPDAVAAAMGAALKRVLPDSPFSMDARPQSLDMYQAFLDKTANGLDAAGGFEAPEQWRFEWEKYYSRDEFLDQIPTQGNLTRLPPEKLAELTEAVGAAIDGGFTMPYATVALAAVRSKQPA